MIDSPVTPGTPNSPVDISIGTGSGSLAEQKLSLSQCEELAKAVQNCSKSLIEGSWSEIPDVRGKRVSFIAADIESAKNFLRSSVKSVSEKRFIRGDSDTPVTPVTTQCSTVMQTRVQTCHACHRVLGGGNHNGSATGKNVCTLIHSELCLGGIPESDNWKACPVGYISNYDYNGAGFSQTLEVQDFQAAQASTPAMSQESAFQQSQVRGLHQQAPDLREEPAVHGQHTPRDSFGRMGAAGQDWIGSPQVLTDSFIEAHRFHRQANGEGARGRVIQERIPSRISFEPGSFPHELEQEVTDLRAYNQQAAQVSLSQQIQGQPTLTMGDIRRTSGLTETVETHLSGFRGQAPVLSSAPSAPAPGLPVFQDDGRGSDPFLTPPLPGTAYQQTGDGIRVTGSSPVMGQVSGVTSAAQQQLAAAKAKFAAIRQQKKVADQQLRDWQCQTDLLHYQNQIQEAEMELQQTQQAFQHLRMSSVHQPQEGVGQAQRRSVLRQVGQQHQGQVYTSPGSGIRHGQDFVQPAQSASEIVVGADGKRYRVPKTQMTQVPEFEIVTGSDGRRYKVPKYQMSEVSDMPSSQQYHQAVRQQYPWPTQVSPSYPLQQGVTQAGQVRSSAPVFPQQQQMLPQAAHQVTTGLVGLPAHAAPVAREAVIQSNGSVSEQLKEKLRGIVNLDDNEGARKPVKLIDYAKKCPAKWCKQIKPTTMNLPVFGYGAASELIESLSGRSEPVSENVLLAKLCHLRDVFEICCINSTDTEFCDYGWTLARDYAQKVQEKVEQQQHSWATHTGIRTDVLLSAQMEFPRPAKKAAVDPKKGEKDKPLCTTYNKCSTEGKCDYEVTSGRPCQRKHECTWCKKHKNQSLKHQESKCPGRVAAGK